MATVIIPWRGGDEQRERIRDFLKPRFASVRTLYAEYNEEPWCKALAVLPALKSAPSDVVAIVDADVWTDGLDSAIRAVTVGAAQWAVPHKTVYRLDERATEGYMQGHRLYGPTERRPYEGVWGGGIVVAHRDTLLEVPMDPRFKGPGQEDEAFGIALQTLKGPGWRGSADLIHLWHPPLPRFSARKGSIESWELYRRYAMANGNPDEMRALLDEPFSADEPPVPDRAPVAG